MASLVCPICQGATLDAQRTSPCPHCATFAIGPAKPDAALVATTRDRMASKDDDDEGVSEKPMPKGKKRPADDDDGKVSEKPLKKKAASSDDEDDEDDAPRKRKEGKKGGMSVGMILGIVGVLLLCCVCLPAGGGVGFVFLGPKLGGSAQRTQSINNAKNIGLAMHSYHDMSKHLPSQQAVPGDLSWRVTVLPFLEQGPLFNRFDKNGGWNKGQNQPLINERPNLYETPHNPAPDNRGTRVQYFVGPNTLFPNATAKPRMVDITDGTSNTAMFGEARGPVGWPMPSDMSIQPAGGLPVPDGRFLMAFGDGTVRFIDRSRVNDAQLRLLIDPRDGMPIPPGVLD